MDDAPSTNGDNGPAPDEGDISVRNEKGRFLPGNPGGPGNPQARNVGAWRRALADAVSPDDIGEVVAKLTGAAKEGKAWAIRELLDRCLGKPTVQVEIGADVERQREWSEREQEEARHIARIRIREMLDEDRQAGQT
jgi:hypothetical protein